MDIIRLKNLAGVSTAKTELETNKMLNEATVIPENASLDQLMGMLDASKRGLGLINRLRNPADKKKHLSAVFVNLNKIRASIARMIKDMPDPVEELPPEV